MEMDHGVSGSRLEKWEEMQWSTVRQKDASKTEGPAILYGTETQATTNKQEKRIEINEMRMIRWSDTNTRSGTNTSEEQRA